MKITIKTKNIELNEVIKELIDDKINGLEKFIKSYHKDDEWEKIKPSCEFSVEIEKETRHYEKGPYFRAEIQVYLPRKTLIAEARSENLQTAITEIKDEMQSEIKKYKSKVIDKNRKIQRNFLNKLV